MINPQKSSKAIILIPGYESGVLLGDVNGDGTISLKDVSLIKYYICAMAGSYIPLPGATGLMEIAFIALYGEFVGDAIVWALLAWRILSYYLILVHGFIQEVVNISRGMAKSRKLKKEFLRKSPFP